MRSIQCHLKTTGGFQSHPHLKWWLEESNVRQHQPLQPLKYALQIFTDASKERWGAHLNKHTATGTWSLPESKLYINYLELKAVFFTLNEFCENSRVLIAKVTPQWLLTALVLVKFDPIVSAQPALNHSIRLHTEICQT